jgi:hypothetical protein
MTSYLISVLEKEIVDKKGVGVILTTHSPSTVAMAPEDSLYKLSKSGTRKRLEKIDKEAALRLLTDGVPTLGVSYENRRQVFVESRYDVEYYEKLYNALLRYRQLHELPISDVTLSFQSSGGTAFGDCELVKQHVAYFKKNDVGTVLGVIDWDGKNGGNDRVFVNGKDKRYSIESYLLDPVLVGVLLLGGVRKDRGPSVRTKPEDLGLPPLTTAATLPTLGQHQIQAMTDAILAKLKRDTDAEVELIDCKYLQGFTIKLPQWFLKLKGHKHDKKPKAEDGEDEKKVPDGLEVRYRSAFPELNSFQGDSFNKEVLEVVLSDHPSLLQQDFAALFDKLSAQQV